MKLFLLARKIETYNQGFDYHPLTENPEVYDLTQKYIWTERAIETLREYQDDNLRMAYLESVTGGIL